MQSSSPIIKDTKSSEGVKDASSVTDPSEAVFDASSVKDPSEGVSNASSVTIDSALPNTTETSISKLYKDLSELVDNKDPFFVLLFQKGTRAGSIKASIINDEMNEPTDTTIEFQKTNEDPLEQAITKYISPGLKEFYNTVSVSPSVGGSRKHSRRHKQKKNKNTKRRSRK